MLQDGYVDLREELAADGDRAEPTARPAISRVRSAHRVVGRALYALLLGQRLQRRALIVGAGWAGREIAQTLATHGDGTCELVGFVDDDLARQGEPVDLPGRDEPLHVLGSRYDLPTLIERHGVTTLVLAITHDAHGPLLQTLLDCLELGVDIVPMPLLYERLTGRVPVMHVGGSWNVALPIDHPGTGALWPALKRLIDVTLAAVGLLLLLPWLPILALAIYVDCPGPILYMQERVGKGGRIFRVFKLRSMVPQAEKEGAVWAEEDDPRVTGLGRFLRRVKSNKFVNTFWAYREH
jgi:hypothetical protein